MYEIYTIQNGDTIEIIAQKLGIDPTILYQINGLTPNYVPSAGTNIIIPQRRNNNFSYYTIKKGDNLYTIAKHYNIDVNTLAKLNGLNISDYIYPNQRLIIPKSGYSFYITKDGDTLEIVRDKFNKNWEDILKYNETIYLLPGQLMINKNN